ncbi:MAG TPA: acyl carrier protein [Candidatus Staskawiczbacteria bacterium]|nr:acyl carrier protein [Candidatus Staskawiczbacteria bacterium]
MTEEKSVRDRVFDVVASQLGMATEQFDEKSRIKDDLGADSLDAVELIMELEEEFDIDIPDDDSEKVVTVGDAVNLIERLLAQSQG